MATFTDSTDGIIAYGSYKGQSIQGIPEGVERWRARFRINEFATIFLKFSDGRMEQRYLIPAGQGALKPESWALGTNRRGGK
jgi:hypothetical protein